MFTALKNFPYDKARETEDNIAWYNAMLDNIKRIETGEPATVHENPQLSLIWSEVNFIGTLNTDYKGVQTKVLRQRLNMMKAVIKHIGSLTYKEYLGLFPVPIHFDGSVLDSLYSDAMSTFVECAYETLSECGVDLEVTDMDDVVGKNECFPVIINSNEHHALTGFHRTLYSTFKSLLKRDKELGNKYQFDELMYNTELLL